MKWVKHLAWLVQQSHEYRNQVFIIVILSLGVTVVELVSIATVFPLVDVVLANDVSIHPYLQFWFDKVDRVTIVFLFLIIFLIRTVFLTLASYFQNTLIYRISNSLSCHIFGNYLARTFSIDRIDPSAVTREVILDTNLYNGAFRSIVILATEVVLILSLALFFLYLFPLIAVSFSLFVIILYVVVQKLSVKYVKRWGSDRKRFDDERLGALRLGLDAGDEINLYEVKTHFFERYRRSTSDWGRVTRNQVVFEALPRIWLELLLVSIGSFTLIGLLYFDGDTASMPAGLAVLFVASIRVLPSGARVFSAVQRVAFCTPVLEMIQGTNTRESDYLENADVGNVFDSVRYPSSYGQEKYTWCVKFDKVDFAYEGGGELLFKNLSFEVPSTGVVGILGRSGIGKSTLAKLMVGLLPPDEGKISWPANRRLGIGWVPQAQVLLNGDIEANILFGKSEGLDRERLELALDVSGLLDIPEYKDRLSVSQSIGFDGSQLSGGQRKRIGIARGVYHGTRILLLDEPFNGLDLRSAKRIKKALRELGKTQAVIVIQHEYSDDLEFDQIITLATSSGVGGQQVSVTVET